MASTATSRPMLVPACLNGGRRAGEHPALPLDPDQLAAAAREAVAAGAAAIHVHQRDADGSQTLAAEPCARVLRAIRSACPGVPVGLTTGAWIEPDPDRRLDLVARWEVAPDYASVNLSEDGAVPLLRLLLLLLEAMEREPAALANVAAMERLLDGAGCRAPQLQHGEGAAAWPVLARALEAGRDVRIGLEDALELPDGQPAGGNAELVAAAARLAREAGRRLEAPLPGRDGRDRVRRGGER